MSDAPRSKPSASTLNEICDRFEDAWLDGQRPSLEQYLGELPSAGRATLLRELLKLELYYRRQREEYPTLDEYRLRFPNDGELLLRVFTDASATPADAIAEGAASGRDRVYAALPGEALPSVPGYEVLELLGAGGMGRVYRAFDCQHRRAVALKVMQRLDPSALYQFKQEFRSLVGLCHPNLITLYELADGPPLFFTMELVEGVDFLTHVRGGRMAVSALTSTAQIDRLRNALRQLVEGVTVLHAAGKVHRDIKPSNVLVTPQGRVVLLDFGLAADLDHGGTYLSLHPHLVGTLAYMAPEQAARQPVSPASDWYAVGVMLYEALTGRLPFDGDPFEVMSRKQQQDPPELGEFSPEAPAGLAELCLGLLQRDPQARPAGAEVLHRLDAVQWTDTEAPRPVPSRLEVPLVGRQSHLQDLESAFERMRQGHVVVLALHGRSGVGKSALLHCFLDRLKERDDTVVLAGRCYEQESVPYKALDSLIDALSRYLERLTPAAAQELLPRDIWELAGAFPVLARLEAVRQAPRRGGVDLDPQERRRRVGVALRELLARLGDRHPLVLAIDDLQWGDRDSATLLADLLQPPDPPVLLLLGSYRSEDIPVSPCLSAFQQLLRQGEGVDGRELAVGPLSPEEQRELARALLPPDDLAAEANAERIARQSGGYPFFMHELAQHLQKGPQRADGGEGPGEDAALPEVLWSRVRRLPEEARSLLEVVAVAGQPVGQEQACQAAAIQGDPLRALAQLRSARLLRVAGPGERHELETYHDHIRESVASHLESDVRRQYHRRLAEELKSAGGSDPEVLAFHWDKADEPARAGHYYALAAAQAADALAFDRAARLYCQALKLQTQSPDQECALRTRLGDVLAAAGRGGDAATEYLEAARHAPSFNSLDLRGRAATQYLLGGHFDDALALLRDVLAAVGISYPSSPLRAILSLKFRRAVLWARGLGFRERPEADVPAAELTRLDTCRAVALGLSMIDPIRGSDFQTRYLLLALGAGEPARVALALAYEAGYAAVAGVPAKARADRLLADADALARRLDDPYVLGMVQICRGVVGYLCCSWQESIVACDRADDILAKLCAGVGRERDTLTAFWLYSLYFHGELKELASRLPTVVRDSEERGDRFALSSLGTFAQPMAALCQDDPDSVQAGMAEAIGPWTRQAFQVPHYNHLVTGAQVELYAGRPEAAWRAIESRWPALRASQLLRVQIMRVIFVRLRAETALALAARTRGAAFIRAAGAGAYRLEHEDSPMARCFALILRGGLAHLAGERESARRHLADATAACEAAAMHLYAAAARRRLGEVTGGTEGRALVAAADEWMTGQGVRNPARMTEMLAPAVVSQ
jgi:serine/threonine protein kinase